MLYACKGAHTLFTDQREREKEREREGVRESEKERKREGESEKERERHTERETERNREKQRETEREKESERERETERGYLFLKGLKGALAPISYLVENIRLTRCLAYFASASVTTKKNKENGGIYILIFCFSWRLKWFTWRVLSTLLNTLSVR